MSQKPRWYVLQVYSGFEKKTAQAIREIAEKKGLSDSFLEILVPSEEVVELKRGKKVTVEKNYFPGYVLIQMVVSDEAWHMVCSLPKVTSFLGGSQGRPLPVSQAEVNRIMDQVGSASEKPRHAISFEVGEQVRVLDGPFATFSGLVEEVDTDKERMKVSVMIFGRPTPVDLDFGQVEKV